LNNEDFDIDDEQELEITEKPSRRMIDIERNVRERAILVAVRFKNQKREIVEEHSEELAELADTAGADVLFTIIQDRQNLDKAYFIGKGKAEEVATLVEENKADLVIFDDDLGPVQVRNLELMFKCKVVDRSGLILDIFASRARSKEAKTQVELAQLEYMLPRLTRAWTHLSKQYGGIGTKGPGETQIETDRRLVRDRITMLKKKLDKIEEVRVLQTSGREGLLRSALVGYTNVGKSTLFNLLTQESVLAEDKLFATLDSTTRGFNLDKNLKILLSDTVGFIRKLPTHLVASFKSTLNEVRESDFILHIIDITHPFYEEQIRVVEDTLKELGCEDKTQIKLFNKVDALEDKERIEYVMNKYENAVVISAARGINLDAFFSLHKKLIEETFVSTSLTLKASQSKLIASIHHLTEVTSINYEDDVVFIECKGNKKNIDKILAQI